MLAEGPQRGGRPYRNEHPPGIAFLYAPGMASSLLDDRRNGSGATDWPTNVPALAHHHFESRTILPYLSIDAFQPGGTTTVVSNSSSTSGPLRAPRKRLLRGKIRVRSSPVFA